MTRVSIVVPTYNQVAYLPTCLDSVWFQDYPELEIVVVDDASTDGTAEALAQYAVNISSERTSFASNYNEETGVVERQWGLRYPPEGRRLALLRHESNKGLSAALNTGFKAVSGEYCTFIASDDMLLPTMVSDLAAALSANDADFAYADMHIVDDNGRILRRFNLPDYSFEDAFCRWYLCGICKLYKRSLHERFGYYDLEYTSQDHEMFLRFAMNGATFVHVPKVLANVRIHEKDRKKDNHTPEMESRQIQDSIQLVMRARQFASQAG